MGSVCKQPTPLPYSLRGSSTNPFSSLVSLQSNWVPQSEPDVVIDSLEDQPHHPHTAAALPSALIVPRPPVVQPAQSVIVGPFSSEPAPIENDSNPSSAPSASLDTSFKRPRGPSYLHVRVCFLDGITLSH